MEKALASSADAAILDLEDAVAVTAKPAARQAVVGALAGPRGTRAFVRVNAFTTPWCFDDVAAVAAAAPDGIILPKLEDVGELAALHWALCAHEARHGLGLIELMPILETALGLARLPELAARAAALGGRVRRLVFGAVDYALDTGLALTRDEAELAAPRAAIAVHSRAAGLEAPIDTVWTDIRDAEGYAASCARGAAAGFQGRMCIHPDQIAAAHTAYSPAEAEVARARRLLAAFAQAQAQGLAAIQVEGRMVDIPVALKARRIVELAERIAGR